MKKTMFITSVIMVVVMAIALTTSSLAWFSASNGGEVGTNAVTISARSNVSQGLYIARNTTDFQTGTIDLNAGVEESYIPVVPYGASAADTAANILYALQRNQFVGNNQKTEAGVNLFSNNYVQGYTYGSGTAAFYKVEDLYVANSGNQDINVKASIAITAEDEDGAILYVAVLARHERAEYDKINGDTSDDGMLTGYIDANGNATKDAGEVVYASKYVVVTPADPANPESEDVYGYVLYIDEDGDGQITGREQKTVAAYLEENELTSTAIVGEQFGTETEEAYAARDYVEANTNRWELLAFANSDETDTLILGRYNDDPVYKTNAAGDKYVLSDDSEVVIAYKNQNGPETDEAFAARKAAQIAELSDPTRGSTLEVPVTDAPVLVRLDTAGQNNYFETDSVVEDAYLAAGVEPSINAATSFVLRGTKQELKNGNFIEEQWGDYMQVKVIAWYSNDLSNSNSGAYNEETNPFGTTKSFTVTFEIAE